MWVPLVIVHVFTFVAVVVGVSPALRASVPVEVNGTRALLSSRYPRISIHDIFKAGAGHAANTECDVQLGTVWPWNSKTDVARRFTVPHDALLIVEVGGNVGEDVGEYSRRYPNAQIHAYEPIPQLATSLRNNFASNPKITVHGFGVSDTDTTATFTFSTGNRPGHEGESSSGVNTTVAGTPVQVQLRDVNAVLSEVRAAAGRNPDVVSVNCEGCEYAVLRRMAETGWLQVVRYVQLSWHTANGVPDRVSARCGIESELRLQYQPVWWSDYGWQAWQLKR